MSGKVVRFVSLTKDQYLNLADDKKYDDTLFFCSGTNEIFKGSQLYGKPSNEKLIIGGKEYDGTERVEIDEYTGNYVIADVDEDINENVIAEESSTIIEDNSTIVIAVTE